MLNIVMDKIRELYRRETCHICTRVLPVDTEGAVCPDPECQYQDWASKQW